MDFLIRAVHLLFHTELQSQIATGKLSLTSQLFTEKLLSEQFLL